MSYSEFDISKEQIVLKAKVFVLPIIFCSIGLLSYSLQIEYQFFSMGIFRLNLTGVLLLIASFSLVWASSSLGNPTSTNSRHLLISSLSAVVVYFAYHIPFMVEYGMRLLS